MQTLSPELRQAFGSNAPAKGALVSQVRKDSPAARAGIRVGDIVIRVAGKPTEDSRAVQHAVLDLKVGAEVPISVWRAGNELEFKVKTGELPDDAEADTGETGGNGAGGESKLGLALQTLSPELADRLGLDRALKGVVISTVRPQSPAARAGLRSGDVLVEIDRSEVLTAEDAVRRLTAKRNGGHLLRVQRGDDSVYVVLSNGGT